MFRGIEGGQFFIARRQTYEAGDGICQDYSYCHALPIFLNYLLYVELWEAEFIEICIIMTNSTCLVYSEIN